MSSGTPVPYRIELSTSASTRTHSFRTRGCLKGSYRYECVRGGEGMSTVGTTRTRTRTPTRTGRKCKPCRCCTGYSYAGRNTPTAERPHTQSLFSRRTR
eukprot:scaffold200048_cov21-Prasinocladus_malaysianus.AAC.2